MKEKMFIGVDIGGTNMRTALVDIDGKIVQRRKSPTSIHLGPESTLQRLAAECRTLVERAVELGCRVEAVGLGVAGKIDRLKGRVLFSPNLPPLADYPLAPKLRNALGIPVVMENDANAFGLGESWAGSGRGVRNWIGLTLGTGVGGCLILDAKLWNGDDLGFAGEIGHMVVDPDGPRCACGLKGCLEAHASGSALTAGVKAAMADGVLVNGPLFMLGQAGKLEPESVYRCAEQGDPFAQRLFERMGWSLGLAIANLFTFLGIRHAIIGGGVSAGWDRFIGPLHESLAGYSSMLAPDEMVVRQSSLGDDAALIGAARLAWQHFEGT